MSEGNPNNEARLRREIEDLKRQLGEHAAQPGGPPPNGWKPSPITISALLAGSVVILIGAFFAGYLPVQKRDALVRAETAEREKELPRMEVMRVGRSAEESALKLPGTLQAVAEAPILARADGYLKRRLVDLGDRVTAGQVLAEIDAPEVDQQIRQAEAAVEQAQAALEQSQAALEQAEASLVQGKANRDLAKLTADRWRSLAAQGIVSQQDNDQSQAQLNGQNANVQALEKAIAAQRSNGAAAKANVEAAKANVARLQEVQGYRVVKAPFEGVVILRNVDVGALVSAGSTLLYRIAQVGTLRTYVNVPQNDADAVHVGQTAGLTFANLPGQRFVGKVARMANALDPATRTMLVEVAVANERGTLYPGMYGEVDLTGARRNPPLLVPASALIVRADGAQIAAVEGDVVHLRKVVVGRDYGDRIEIVQGLKDGSTILTSAGDVSQEGTRIVPVTGGN